MRHVIIISPIEHKAALQTHAQQMAGTRGIGAFDDTDLGAGDTATHTFAIVPASDDTWAQMQALAVNYAGVELIESDHDNSAAAFAARIAALGLRRIVPSLPGG